MLLLLRQLAQSLFASLSSSTLLTTAYQFLGWKSSNIIKRSYKWRNKRLQLKRLSWRWKFKSLWLLLHHLLQILHPCRDMPRYVHIFLSSQIIYLNGIFVCSGCCGRTSTDEYWQRRLSSEPYPSMEIPRGKRIFLSNYDENFFNWYNLDWLVGLPWYITSSFRESLGNWIYRRINRLMALTFFLYFPEVPILFDQFPNLFHFHFLCSFYEYTLFVSFSHFNLILLFTWKK